MKVNVAVVMGGFTEEFDISLESGQTVLKYLSQQKYNVYPIVITRDKWYYKTSEGTKISVDKRDFSIYLNEEKVSFHVVFNAIHGTPGEDGQLQAYLDLIGIPQTSCDMYTAAITYNKRDLLAILRPYGIKSAESYYMNKGDKIDTKAIVSEVGLPCFVKANKAGSSFGVSKVYELSDLKSAIQKSFDTDDEILIESFLKGTEVSISVVTYKGLPKALPITEIIPKGDFFDYKAKYLGESDEITPARIPESLAKEISNQALKIYKSLKIKGFCRSEFIIVDNTPYLLEVNTTPGLTEASLLPQQSRVAGILISDLFEESIEFAIKNEK